MISISNAIFLEEIIIGLPAVVLSDGREFAKKVNDAKARNESMFVTISKSIGEIVLEPVIAIVKVFFGIINGVIPVVEIGTNSEVDIGSVVVDGVGSVGHSSLSQ